MVSRYASFRELIAAQDPENAAFGYFEGNTRKLLTFGEVLALIDTYPVPDEDVIGIVCDNEISTVTAALALAGKKQLVLLNPMDEPRVLAGEIRTAHVSKLIGHLPEGLELQPLEKGTVTTADILFFTSGTTARNKAVVLDEKRLCSAVYNGGSLLPLTSTDSLLSILPLSHVFGFVCSLLWPLSFGARVDLGRGLKSIFFDFAEFRPTVTSLVPEMAGFLGAKKLFNPELKLILIGAGSCSDQVLAMLKAMGIRVSYGYGLTESSSGIALSLEDDPRAMTICPDYEVTIESDGEISVVSDTTLMKGYYEDEAATREVLKGNRLFTGDLGRLEDGKLFITGRKKDILVLSDGTKIFLPDYEEHLRTILGRDSDFAVFQLKSGALGLAVVKPRDIEAAVDTFNTEYPRGQRISRIFYFDELPKTATGKIRRYDIIAGVYS